MDSQQYTSLLVVSPPDSPTRLQSDSPRQPLFTPENDPGLLMPMKGISNTQHLLPLWSVISTDSFVQVDTDILDLKAVALESDPIHALSTPSLFTTSPSSPKGSPRARSKTHPLPGTQASMGTPLVRMRGQTTTESPAPLVVVAVPAAPTPQQYKGFTRPFGQLNKNLDQSYLSNVPYINKQINDKFVDISCPPPPPPIMTPPQLQVTPQLSSPTKTPINRSGGPEEQLVLDKIWPLIPDGGIEVANGLKSIHWNRYYKESHGPLPLFLRKFPYLVRVERGSRSHQFFVYKVTEPVTEIARRPAAPILHCEDSLEYQAYCFNQARRPATRYSN